MRGFPTFVTIALSLSLGMTAAWAQAPAVDATRAASDAFLRAYGAGVPGRSDIKGLVASADPSNVAAATNDYSALIEQFDERANYAGTLQPFWIRGKAQISDLWARYFARYPDRRMIFRDRDIQVYDNVSIETGYAEMYMGGRPADSVATFMRYSITRVRRGDNWRIINMIVDRLPSEQPPPGVMPPWANTPPSPP